MNSRKKGVSSSIAAAVVVVVLATVAAAYLLQSSSLPPQSATSTTSTSSGNPVFSSTSTSSSYTSTSSSSSAQANSGKVFFSLQASPPLASADVVANYTLSISTLGSVSGAVQLAASSLPGIRAMIIPQSLFLAPGANIVQVSFAVSDSVQPDSFAVNFTASTGGNNFTQSSQIHIVKYLVVAVGTSFVPGQLTVPAGSKVYWIRLNGVLSQYDSGDHNVMFTNGMAASSTLQQWDTYTYTFDTPGTYTYRCTFHPGMDGTVVVT